MQTLSGLQVFRPCYDGTMDFYQQFPDSELNFDPAFEELLEKLTETDITTLELLDSSPVEVAAQFDLNLNILLRFVHSLKREQMHDMFKPQPELFTVSSGDEQIDSMLNGGFETGSLVEVFGASATAKSQFVMQLTKSVSKRGSRSVLISTEGFIETKRLVEINPDLESIFTINCMDLEAQEHILNVQLPTLLNEDKDIKLVVIDSISHHLRVEVGQDFSNLKKSLIDLGLNLKKLASQYSVCIVVTNQISDKPFKTILNSDFKKLTYDYQVGWLNGWDRSQIERAQNNEQGFKLNQVSALGLNWDQFVDVKVLLSKTYHVSEGITQEQIKEKLMDEYKEFWQVQRTIKLIYSKVHNGDKATAVSFQIDSDGIKSL